MIPKIIDKKVSTLFYFFIIDDMQNKASHVFEIHIHTVKLTHKVFSNCKKFLLRCIAFKYKKHEFKPYKMFYQIKYFIII